MRAFAVALAVILALGNAVPANTSEPAPTPAPTPAPYVIKGEAGLPVAIEHSGPESESVRFKILDPGLIPVERKYLANDRVLVAFAPKPGRYKVLMITARVEAGDKPKAVIPEPVTVLVLIGDAQPDAPDNPPAPDPVVAELRSAWAKERDPARTAQRDQLAALYRQVAKLAGDPKLDTNGAIWDVAAEAATRLGVAGKLPILQSAVRAKVLHKVPDDADLKLDDASRALWRDAYGRAADLVSALP